MFSVCLFFSFIRNKRYFYSFYKQEFFTDVFMRRRLQSRRLRMQNAKLLRPIFVRYGRAFMQRLQFFET